MNEREHRRADRLRVDETAMRAAAQHVRSGPARASTAGLSDPRVAAACGELLDVLADNLDRLPAQIRDHTCRVSRELIGEPMDQPTRRRTRHR